MREALGKSILQIGLFLALAQVVPAVQGQEPAKPPTDLRSHLELGRKYEVWDDLRAEQEFKLALADGGKTYPKAFLELSRHYSSRLNFSEAADSLDSYIRLTPRKNHLDDLEEVKDLEKASRLKQQVDASNKPSLKDLQQLTHFVIGYGRKHQYDAVPYAEKAVELYPDSVAALLLLVSVLPHTQSEGERELQLLNHAALVEPENPTVYSARGFVYLDTFRKSIDAENDFRRALSLSQDADSNAWKGLGYVFIERGQKHDAIVAFRKYLSFSKAATPDYEITKLIESLERNTQ